MMDLHGYYTIPFSDIKHRHELTSKYDETPKCNGWHQVIVKAENRVYIALAYWDGLRWACEDGEEVEVLFYVAWFD